MRIAFFLLLIGCGSTQAVDDTSGPDATADTTMMPDAPTNDTGSKMDTGVMMDTGTDSSTDDSGVVGDSGITLDGGGGVDGSLCPPCMMGFKCCTVMKSFNYGKCYDSKCLACCM